MYKAGDVLELIPEEFYKKYKFKPDGVWVNCKITYHSKYHTSAPLFYVNLIDRESGKVIHTKILVHAPSFRLYDFDLSKISDTDLQKTIIQFIGTPRNPRKADG